jgi:hypothetical protein
MEIEKLLKETFEAHEHVAPDGDKVLAGARQRMRRKVSRPLAVAAGVVVLTLAAVTVVVLNRPSDPAKVAAPPVQATNTTPPKPAVAGLPMPYDLAWLPPGDVEYLARRINIGGKSADDDSPVYGGEYMVTVKNNGHTIDIDVQEFKVTPVDHAAFKSGPGSPVTINGRRGIESAVSDGPGGYELYLDDGNGGSLYIGVMAENGDTAPTQQLIDTGRRVAQNIRFPGTMTVTPAFGLRDLPAGMRICAWDVEKGFDAADAANSNTSYQLGACDTMPPVHVSITGKEPGGTPGQPVQGHRTSYVDESGYITVFVLDAVNGEPIGVAGKVPLATLYDIANRLVLPS